MIMNAPSTLLLSNISAFFRQSELSGRVAHGMGRITVSLTYRARRSRATSHSTSFRGGARPPGALRARYCPDKSAKQDAPERSAWTMLSERPWPRFPGGGLNPHAAHAAARRAAPEKAPGAGRTQMRAAKLRLAQVLRQLASYRRRGAVSHLPADALINVFVT